MIEYREGTEIKRKEYNESKAVHILAIAVSLMMAIFVFYLSRNMLYLYERIISYIVSYYALVYAYKSHQMDFSKFNIDLDGINAKYPFHAEKLISWDEFQQVCVCYGDYSKAGISAFVYICFIKKGAKKDFYGRWKANTPSHYRKIITMNYTDELYEEVKNKCPYEVVDLRNTRIYRL